MLGGCMGDRSFVENYGVAIRVPLIQRGVFLVNEMSICSTQHALSGI